MTKDRNKAWGAARPAEKARKPWGGDLGFPRKPASTWLNDIVVACLSLPLCLERMGFAAFKSSWVRQAAALHHIHQIGEAASRQPASVRRRYPDVDWKALVSLRDRTGLPRDLEMTPKEIWDFVRRDVPVLQEKLADAEGLLVAERRIRDGDRLSIKDINHLLREGRRRSRRKAARAAAEARIDASLLRIATKRIADFDAGRVRAISSKEVAKSLGVEPAKPQKPFNHRYDFVFWLEDGLWTAKAPSVRGTYGIGVTALEAKDDLVEALELLSLHTRESGEPKTAALCDRLVASWKNKTRRRKTSSRRN
ncbi:MAG: HepT-like ribonuclease domain-containing protein [Polyangia bacterium]|jgi:uncharacterized protein with HEPN domain